MIFFLERVENILEKEQNAGFIILSFFNTVSAYFLKVVKTLDIMVKEFCVLRKVENILDKGENAGYQHFLLFMPPSPLGRLGAYSFWPVHLSFCLSMCLSVKTFTLALSFDW